MNIALACFKYSSAKTFPQDVVLLAEELHARGHRITLYCRVIAAGSTLPDYIQVKVLPGAHWGNARRAGKFVRTLHEALKVDKPDILVAFNRIPGADFYYATTRCIAATPISGLAFLRRLTPRYRFNLALEKRVFRPKAKTCILYISASQKKEYQASYGTPDKRFFKLPPDIPSGCGRPADAPERRARIREELELTEKDILLLVIGNFRIAGADRAIAALASLPPELQERTQLVLAGSGNVSAMRRLADWAGVKDRVRFTLIDNELNDLILGSDLLLHPARGEAAGTAPLEALYAGVPVLASSSGGWAREIVEADSMLIPAPFRQVTFNRALRLLLSTPSKLEEMTREAIAIGTEMDVERRFEVAADIITGKHSK
ncbi:MAG: glycosyltransferase family 4 protein [Lentisphaeria bacterium]|nr:glycosyltransferase family 4 protein [Lentisphaeria bacterium]